LFEHAKMLSGQRILVLGASGNVGSMAVQLAYQHGAYTIAAIASDDTVRMRQLGANEVLDLRNGAQVQGLGLVDAVIDAAGGESQRMAITKLKPGGVIISAVSAPDAMQLEAQGAMGSFILVRTSTECLQQLAELIDTGKLLTRVGQVLPLHQARMAHEMLDGLRAYARGKIVLTTHPDAR